MAIYVREPAQTLKRRSKRNARLIRNVPGFIMTTQTIRKFVSDILRAASGLRAVRLSPEIPFPLSSDTAAFRAFGALRPALAQNPQNHLRARTRERFAHSNGHAAR